MTEFIAGDESLIVKWTTDASSTHISTQAQAQTQQPMVDAFNHAQDAVLYFSMKATQGLTWQNNADVVCRSTFANTSALQNTSDSTFRAVNERWPVFSIAVDVGSVGSAASDPVVWTLGVVRNPSIFTIQYTGETSQAEYRSAYYWSNFSSAIDVVSRLSSI